MKRRIAVGLALALALLGSTVVGTATAQAPDPRPDAVSDPRQNAADESWRADDQGDAAGSWDKRDNGRDQGYDTRDQRNSWDRGNGWGQRAVADFQGRWVSVGRPVDSRPEPRDFRGRGSQGGFLPGYLRISQRPGMLRIADYDNRTLQQIMIANRYRSPNDGRGYLTGRWRGSKLEVERDGPRGSTIIQTFSIENRGRTLVVRTRQEGGRSRPVAEFTSTYRRA
ncbi:MAG TPA: hypothetical protein VGK76_01560 [Candidatus Eisenbacteria bacterium]|jgi:hypothetical protein